MNKPDEKATIVTFGRPKGTTDAEWAAECKQMAEFLRRWKEGGK